jgi:hypothetical protein
MKILSVLFAKLLARRGSKAQGGARRGLYSQNLPQFD